MKEGAESLFPAHYFFSLSPSFARLFLIAARERMIKMLYVNIQAMKLVIILYLIYANLQFYWYLSLAL